MPVAGLGVCLAAATAATRAEPRTPAGFRDRCDQMPADDARLLRKLAHATEHAVAALEAAKQKQDLLAAAKSAADALENKSVPSSAGRVRGGIVVDVADPTAQVHSARADARHVKSNARQLTNDATAAASNVLAVVQAAAASDVIATLNRADQATTASAARAAVHTYWVKGSSEPTILATEMSKASGLRGLQPLELLNVFSAVDKTLTKPALVRALPLADPATVGRLFDIFAGDADGDGTDDIGYRTFVCAAAIMADAKPAAKLKLMFELCDEDSTGVYGSSKSPHTLPLQ